VLDVDRGFGLFCQAATKHGAQVNDNAAFRAIAVSGFQIERARQQPFAQLADSVSPMRWFCRYPMTEALPIPRARFWILLAASRRPRNDDRLNPR